MKKMYVREIPEGESIYNINRIMELQKLKTSELIAIITRGKETEVEAIEKAERLLVEIKEDLNQLKNISYYSYKRMGYSKRQVIKLLASLQLYKRAEIKENTYISSPDDVFMEIRKLMESDEVECFFVILLDTKNRIIKSELVSKGILDASLVHPREIFKSAIRNNASSLILAHNHPSNNVTPSCQDIEITKTIIESGKILNIPVTDHVIVGRTNYLSMKEKRYAFN